MSMSDSGQLVRFIFPVRSGSRLFCACMLIGMHVSTLIPERVPRWKTVPGAAVKNRSHYYCYYYYRHFFLWLLLLVVQII